jgi:hypothetical protein
VGGIFFGKKKRGFGCRPALVATGTSTQHLPASLCAMAEDVVLMIRKEGFAR